MAVSTTNVNGLLFVGYVSTVDASLTGCTRRAHLLADVLAALCWA